MAKDENETGSDPQEIEGEELKWLAWISDKYRGRHDERRRYEARYLFATLTVFVLGVWAAIHRETKLPEASTWVVWSVMLILAVLACIFLVSIHVSNRNDMDKAEAAETKILGRWKIPPGKAERRKYRRWLARYRNLIIQMLSIIALAVASSLLIQSAIRANAPNPNRTEEPNGSKAANGDAETENRS